ncbi:DDE-1 domain containing protein [Pyrenophora tritici-repentis]|nr:DDE-1 domain containing protein [Pyrenophora tritici-repentis]
MREYNVEERDIYNMDEKGFFVTLLACVCAPGEALPPALIYQGTSGLQSGWVDAVEVGKHEVFFANSPFGWTNNELGLAWLEQVFDRYTKAKARRGWRLLILDGHGSHVTTDFIDFCDGNRIPLALFPPYSTYSLQPLDVVLFSPLSTNYTKELNRSTHRSQGITRITKRAFFSNLGGMELYNEAGDHNEKFSNYRRVADGCGGFEAKRLLRSIHSLQVNYALLYNENSGLQQALNTKKKHKTKRTILDLRHRDEYYGGAVFWSPRKLREATKQDEAEQLQL